MRNDGRSRTIFWPTKKVCVLQGRAETMAFYSEDRPAKGRTPCSAQPLTSAGAQPSAAGVMSDLPLGSGGPKPESRAGAWTKPKQEKTLVIGQRSQVISEQ